MLEVLQIAGALGGFSGFFAVLVILLNDKRIAGRDAAYDKMANKLADVVDNNTRAMTTLCNTTDADHSALMRAMANHDDLTCRIGEDVRDLSDYVHGKLP